MAMKRKEGWDRGRDLGEKIASTTLPPKSRHTHGIAEGTEGRKNGRIEWRKGIIGYWSEGRVSSAMTEYGLKERRKGGREGGGKDF
jgi:hypothetical protein